MKKLLTLLSALILLAASCKRETDPCEKVTCLNNGTCVNGTCNCPDGYYGADCSLRHTPTAMVIKSITVTNFPDANVGNAYWDQTPNPSDADLGIGIFDAQQNTLYESTTIFNACCATQGYSWNNLNVYVASPTEQITILLGDDDTTLNEDNNGGQIISQMGALLYPTAQGGFPTSISFTSGNFSVTLEVSYYF